MEDNGTYRWSPNGSQPPKPPKKNQIDVNKFSRYIVAGLLVIALVIAGLTAEGTTRVENIHYVERGYERIIEKLTALGAKIRKVEE